VRVTARLNQICGHEKAREATTKWGIDFSATAAGSEDRYVCTVFGGRCQEEKVGRWCRGCSVHSGPNTNSHTWKSASPTSPRKKTEAACGGGSF
jgi:hypothetical protein